MQQVQAHTTDGGVGLDRTRCAVQQQLHAPVLEGGAHEDGHKLEGQGGPAEGSDTTKANSELGAIEELSYCRTTKAKSELRAIEECIS